MRVEEFKALFEGSLTHYGLSKKGSYLTVKGEVPDDVILDHLNGVARLGLIPQREGKVKFAVVDIDLQGDTFNATIKSRLDSLGIKFHVEKSKSKGFHYWIFFNEWVNAAPVHAYLYEQFVRRYSVEVFPTDPRNPVGNFINLPYFGVNLGTPDAYFIGHPKKLPEIKTNYFDIIKPVIKEDDDEKYQGSNDSEKALRVDMRDIFPRLNTRMFCLFYPKTRKTKSASYYQEKSSGVWFYKEFGRFVEGKEFVLTNIDLYQKLTDSRSDRMEAIYYILGGNVERKPWFDKITNLCERNKWHPLFFKYKNLKGFIRTVADWFLKHPYGNEKSFVSLRYVANMAGINLSTAQYLMKICCMLGLWSKAHYTYTGSIDKAMACYKILEPNEQEFLKAADMLMPMKPRKMQHTDFLSAGFSMHDVARAFLKKQKIYETVHGQYGNKTLQIPTNLSCSVDERVYV